MLGSAVTLQIALSIALIAAGCSNGNVVASSGAAATAMGVVSVISSPTSSSAIASFFASTVDAGAGPECSQKTEGGCTLFACPSNTSADAGTPAQATTGKLTVSIGTTELALTPSAMLGGSPFADHMGPFWTAAGVSVSATATGAEVPAFMLHTESPAPITVTQPTFSGQTQPLIIDTSTALAVAWTGGAAGESVNVFLAGPFDAAAFVEMTCAFPAETGEASIPASLLAMMPKGSNGRADVNVSKSASTVAGNWQIKLAAQSDGVSTENTTDGTSSSDRVELQ